MNRKLQEWVDSVEKMCQPDSVHWCDGSEQENERILKGMVDSGMATPLNPKKRPGCYLFRSHPSDVARVEDRTFIASVRQEDAGPHEQLDRPCRTQKDHDIVIYRLHEGQDDVCHAVFHGPGRLENVQNRRRDHGQPLRRRQHAHYDAYGHGGPGGSGRRRLCEMSAFRRGAASKGRKGFQLALRADGTEVYKPFPRGADDLVLRLRLWRQRAFGQEMLRPCASRPSRPATRAGWPSIC